LNPPSAAGDSEDGANPGRVTDDLAAELPNISHMLKGTLTVMMGYAEMLTDPSNGEISDGKLMFAGRIASAGRIMRLQLGNMSMFGHLASGDLSLHAERLDLAAEIEEVALEWDGAWGMTLAWSAPRDFFVESDRRALRLVLENLVSNALRHSPAGSPARLEMRKIGHQVSVTASNGGPPIPAADAELLFQPFGRLPGHRGIGLGLFVVKSLLGRLGSTPTLKSDAARGTRFSFTLPLIG
jgi:signal transduction histidine kinase